MKRSGKLGIPTPKRRLEMKERNEPLKFQNHTDYEWQNIQETTP